MNCNTRGKELKVEHLRANVDKNLNPADKGGTVCSMKCAEDYEKQLSHHGKGLPHWSRITGYYQNVRGWNTGKVQELKDRKRHEIK